MNVEYLGTFSDYFQLKARFFPDKCLNFQKKNHAYS